MLGRGKNGRGKGGGTWEVVGLGLVGEMSYDSNVRTTPPQHLSKPPTEYGVVNIGQGEKIQEKKD